MKKVIGHGVLPHESRLHRPSDGPFLVGRGHLATPSSGPLRLNRHIADSLCPHAVVPRDRLLKKEVWIGWFASLVEAYNMAIYTFLVPLLVNSIGGGERGSLLLFYSLVFIGSSLFYPLGAAYYGFMGDKLGRRKICVYSTLGLGVATGLMGFIPYDLGDIAWMLFLPCICAQNFFSGGEYHGSIVFSLEHSGSEKSGFMSSLSCLFAVGGLVIANGFATLTLLKGDELGLRLCFFTGALGGVLSYLFKKRCHETPAFAVLSPQLLKESWNTFFGSNFIKITKVSLVMSCFIVCYSFIFIFLPLHFNSSSIHHFETFTSLIAYGMILVGGGLIADRIGIKKAMAIGALLFSIIVIPLCLLCKDLLMLQLLLILCASLVIGPIHSWMLNEFKVQNRCQGIFISSALAISIFGGSTVPICLMIFEKFHSIGICSIYPLVVTLGAFFCLIKKHPKLSVV